MSTDTAKKANAMAHGQAATMMQMTSVRGVLA